MQTGKKMVESVKETASNVAASAVSGMEKTKATVQEKVDKMWAHDDYEKDLATERKEERKAEAELRKQEAFSHNAADRQANTATATGCRGGGGGGGPHYSHSTTGATGYPTGAQQMSALPGHGTGEPAGGGVVEGTVEAYPIAKGTGTVRPTTAHNTRLGGETHSGFNWAWI